MTQPTSPPDLIRLEEWKPERHVKEAFRKAAALAGGLPIDARTALQAAVLVARKQKRTEAFPALLRLLPLPDLKEPPPSTPPSEGFLLSEPLARAYAAAPRPKRMWGRDYVTIALLSADPSLEQLASEAGTKLTSLRDRWYSIVSASKERDEAVPWSERWKSAGVPLPEAPAPSSGVKVTGQAASVTASDGGQVTPQPDAPAPSTRQPSAQEASATGSTAAAPQQQVGVESKAAPPEEGKKKAGKETVKAQAAEPSAAEADTAEPAATAASATLGQLLADPVVAGRLRAQDRAAYLQAAAVALDSGKPLTPMLLLACLLRTADPTDPKSSSAHLLKSIDAARGGTENPFEDIDGALLADLQLESGQGITSLDLKFDESSILSATLDVGIAREVLTTAESYRRLTRPRAKLSTRHHLAALIGQPVPLAGELDGLGIDARELRKTFFAFIADQHSKDKLDLWREILDLVAEGQPEPEGETPAEPGEEPTSEPEPDPFAMRTKAARDTWTYDDLLGYGVYVRAIVKPILLGSTRPPLTVGIQAPWGQGKTSLMRMIQAELDPASRERSERYSGADLKTSVQATYRRLRDWLGEFGDAAKAEPKDAPVEPREWQTEPIDLTSGPDGQRPRRPGMLIGPDRKLPSVWFNPLYYQDQEQVWAGLAHAILHQLAGQLPDPVDREKFWFRLRLSRINESALRRDVTKAVFTRFLPSLAGWLAAGVVAVAGLALALPSGKLDVELSAVLGFLGSVGGAVLHFFTRFRDGLKLDKQFEAYVSEPSYESRLGLLHLVDTDLDRALHLAAGEYPIAIFVDDLDRCDPDIVADVILAINQFLSLPHRNVFFFLGMDMQIVAAALERAKGPQDGEMAVSRRGKSFGWQFMEKFVQLPFIIPQMEKGNAEDYMKALLKRPAAAATAQPSAEEAAEAEREATERRAAEAQAAGFAEDLEEVTDVDGVAQLGQKVAQIENQVVRDRIQESLSDKVSELMEDPASEEVQRIIEIALEDLDLNPRAIKRYGSVARLLRAVHVARGQRGEPDNDRRLVLRAAHLLLDWPEFVHWLQNNPEVRTADGERVETVERLESIVLEAKDLSGWRESLNQTWGQRHTAVLDHAELFHQLRKITTEPPGLAAMVSARIF